MRTLTYVEKRLDEDLDDLLRHIRMNYAFNRMTVEEHHQVVAVYQGVKSLSEKLLDGTLSY